MNKIIQCTDCAHCEPLISMVFCKATDKIHEVPISIYAEKIKMQRYEFRPTIESMRAINGKCGPEAKLFKLKWWKKLFK